MNRPFAGKLGFAFVFLCLSSFTIQAAEIDLTGTSVGPGKSFSKASGTTVPATLLYNVALSGTGTTTGSAAALGTGDFIALLNQLSPTFSTRIFKPYAGQSFRQATDQFHPQSRL
ncbi:MAG: hypothetical protein QM796_10245 [Chthoniobacteraceae bacterium]